MNIVVAVLKELQRNYCISTITCHYVISLRSCINEMQAVINIILFPDILEHTQVKDVIFRTNTNELTVSNTQILKEQLHT